MALFIGGIVFYSLYLGGIRKRGVFTAGILLCAISFANLSFIAHESTSWLFYINLLIFYIFCTAYGITLKRKKENSIIQNIAIGFSILFGIIGIGFSRKPLLISVPVVIFVLIPAVFNFLPQKRLRGF